MTVKRIILSLLVMVLTSFTYGCENKKEDIKTENHRDIKPMSLNGIWNITNSKGDSGRMSLRQQGGAIFGRYIGKNNPRDRYIVHGEISSQSIILELQNPKSDVPSKLSGTVKGNKMIGKWIYGDQSGTWEATKSNSKRNDYIRKSRNPRTSQ
ncbi:MAG: hypothetical protein ACE5H1_11375 [Thermodesulfobacteriota bacterium]